MNVYQHRHFLTMMLKKMVNQARIISSLNVSARLQKQISVCRLPLVSKKYHHPANLCMEDFEEIPLNSKYKLMKSNTSLGG